MTSRRAWIWIAAFALLGLGVFALAHRRPAPPRVEADAATQPEVASAPPAAAPAPEEEPPPREPRPPELLDPEPMGFAGVDLEAVRDAMPDNLYWELAAPTQDPRLLAEREREKARRNEQYGKILSGTGTEDEIRDYYDHRNRMSADYVRFVDHVLDHYGDDLAEQDLELLHVARRLHLARLQEVPRRLQEALDRKREQDAAREAWLADEQAFEAAQQQALARETAERESAAATPQPPPR